MSCERHKEKKRKIGDRRKNRWNTETSGLIEKAEGDYGVHKETVRGQRDSGQLCGPP